MMTFLPGDQLIRLAAAPNQLQAHLLEIALRSEGIRSQVVGDSLIRATARFWKRRPRFGSGVRI
jgi:hypothetical protein